MKYLLGLVWSCIVAQAAAQDFLTIPAGTYTVGAKHFPLNPLRTVQLPAFRISTTEITNAQFAAFVDATGYITDAERRHNAMVFEPGLKEFRWLEDSSAYWLFPNGISRGDVADKMDHPVTCISFTDAQAYCTWSGCRLPTLDEWEVAARAGSKTRYFWGEDRDSLSQYANVWLAHDHLVADTADGYMYTSPVAHFKPNPWGLYDVYGNVFEYCEGHTALDKPGSTSVHARGGSWWCSKNSCSSFNSVDIGTVHPRASFSNLGFRVVKL
ncbi:Formylglycine-generating enzyme, required for sulfatase activity, contains SUMF1/FGE domain [Chitinophaga jiangningensis]|uniref:Formylglycine-generating enzyme, required for sulfatase activity, contains SUMF1/FGE domain n=1 Tax=Chitinophaga jiangningensis TaxID=1419482 RepID=A0A1M7AU99_9BACT|nr:SUMF1/EgtB/PvdO family nonheme iron enzyme [Chitinophaga jiangningensis]SHL46313.1 Formylglycine-generating enzyme, required for sulfatase activity, contains SUMF1/FGE domain [Chitinophaga jiangningensis]